MFAVINNERESEFALINALVVENCFVDGLDCRGDDILVVSVCYRSHLSKDFLESPETLGDDPLGVTRGQLILRQLLVVGEMRRASIQEGLTRDPPCL